MDKYDLPSFVHTPPIGKDIMWLPSMVGVLSYFIVVYDSLFAIHVSKPHVFLGEMATH